MNDFLLTIAVIAVHHFITAMYFLLLSTESGPLGGKQTHNPKVSNLGPYHYASGERCYYMTIRHVHKNLPICILGRFSCGLKGFVYL